MIQCLSARCTWAQPEELDRLLADVACAREHLVDERSKMEPVPSRASSGQTINEQRDRRCHQLAAHFATTLAPVGAET